MTTAGLQKFVGYTVEAPCSYTLLRADFREGDEDSNFSVFRVERFSEWPEPLH